MTIIALDRFDSLAEQSGTPTERTAEWIEAMTRQINFNTVISGTGSPEGVVTATPRKLYMDENGTAGSILYIKKSGTGNTGWILV